MTGPPFLVPLLHTFDSLRELTLLVSAFRAHLAHAIAVVTLLPILRSLAVTLRAIRPINTAVRAIIA